MASNGIDPRQFRSCLGRFATGVTVVSCDSGGQVHGATVNAFSAVSLEPPLVMVSLDRRSKACGLLTGRPFTVNVLAEDQRDLALQFAGRPQPDVAVEWIGGAAPRLAGAQAYFHCMPWREYDGGDHVVFLGEVAEFGHIPGEPLIFHEGLFRALSPQTASGPWLESLDCPSSAGLMGIAGELDLAGRSH
jgi:flavin reductase (DIM6/NTAB) family NADH-FMN oxidoreductase RutF